MVNIYVILTYHRIDKKYKLKKEKIMQKLTRWMKKIRISNFLTIFALVFTYIGANSHCHYIFHDVSKPELRAYRKF